MLGRKLERPEHKVSDRHRQALQGSGIEQGSKDGQQRSSQARGDRTRRRRGDAEGNGEREVQEQSGQVGRAICREGDMYEDGESDMRKLEKVDEGMRMSEKGGEIDVGDAGTDTRRYPCECARGRGLGKSA